MRREKWGREGSRHPSFADWTKSRLSPAVHLSTVISFSFKGEQVLAVHRSSLGECEGETWALVSSCWVNKWQEFSGVKFQTSSQGEPTTDTNPGRKFFCGDVFILFSCRAYRQQRTLGRRDYYCLLSRVILDQLKPGSPMLKIGLAEYQDFYILTEQTFTLLKTWFNEAI